MSIYCWIMYYLHLKRLSKIIQRWRIIILSRPSAPKRAWTSMSAHEGRLKYQQNHWQHEGKPIKYNHKRNYYMDSINQNPYVIRYIYEILNSKSEKHTCSSTICDDNDSPNWSICCRSATRIARSFDANSFTIVGNTYATAKKLLFNFL